MAQALDFSSAEVSASVHVYSDRAMVAMVVGLIVCLLLLIAGTVWVVLRDKNSETAYTLPLLHDLSPPLKLVAAMVFVSMLLVQVVAALDAYVQTHVVQESVLDYFQNISWVRLLGTTHSHAFGFGIMYGVMALLLTMTSASQLTKCLLIATLLWSGLFDLISWWGIKYFSARFHWLSLTSGTLSGVVAVAAMFLVGRGLFQKR